jgi:hypothetical protein
MGNVTKVKFVPGGAVNRVELLDQCNSLFIEGPRIFNREAREREVVLRIVIFAVLAFGSEISSGQRAYIRLNVQVGLANGTGGSDINGII